MAHETNAKEMILHNVQIAAKCPANWNDMSGDEKKRFCGQCKLHVHNLSAMTEADAEQLLQSRKDEGACIRFYRRLDGKILTKDCPVGLRLLQTPARVTIFLFKAASAIAVFVVAVIAGAKALEVAKATLQTTLSQSFSEVAAHSTGNMYIPPDKKP